MLREQLKFKHTCKIEELVSVHSTARNKASTKIDHNGFEYNLLLK